MGSQRTGQGRAAFYKALPKVELHRHLEGSLRLATLLEIAGEHGIELPGVNPRGGLRSLVQIRAEEPYTFENFLSKFKTLRLFYRSPEVIGRITREAVADAAADNVRYLELRFTPVALSRAEGFPLAEVMDWVVASAGKAAADLGVMVRLIASANRHEDPRLAEQVARLAAERLEAGLVGLDLAGDEANFSAQPFAAIFREARRSGLHVTVHAGEWSGAENVVEAVEILGAERIGHGVRVMEDEQAVKLCRARGTAFEVCLTSNYQSGVVTDLKQHPLRAMLTAGLRVTLNTDDPSISQIELSDEYRLACEELGLSVSELRRRVFCAADAAFLPLADRQRLVASLEAAFPSGAQSKE